MAISPNRSKIGRRMMANIMVVDDDMDLAAATQRALEANGHTVKVALDIDTAREMLRDEVPDLVILDVMFPEDSAAGFDLAREIHADERLSSIPILMLTAINTRIPLGFSSEDIDDAWLPVDNFLEKPVDFDTLLAKVAKMLEAKGSEA